MSTEVVTLEGMGHLLEFNRHLRRFAAHPDEAHRCDCVRAYVEVTGREPVASECVAFADTVEAELVQFKPVTDGAAITFAEEAAMSPTAQREADRRDTQEWAASRQPARPAEAVAFTEAAAAASPVARPSGRAEGPPPGFPREPDRLAGLTAEGLAAASRLGIDVRSLAARDLAALPPAGSCGVRAGSFGQPATFDRVTAERVARYRSACRAIVEGREVDGDAIDRESAVELIASYWTMGRPLAALVGSAGEAARWYEARAGRPDLAGLGYLELPRVCERALAVDAEVAKCLARAAALRAALEALPAALASRVGPVVAEIGGPEALATMLREAATLAKVFPGPDDRLDRLRLDYDEADARMKQLCPPRGEPAGELFTTAAARRDELVEAVSRREQEVRAAASERLKSGVASVMAGTPENVSRLTATARRIPEAFPPHFADRLDSAALGAVLEADAIAFSYCL